MNLNFIIRTILFIALSIWLYNVVALFVLLVLGILPIFVIGQICNYLDCLYETVDKLKYDKFGTLGFEFTMYALPYLFSPLTCWLYAKIFGLFKELDKLKLPCLLKYILLIIISLLTFTTLLLPLSIDTGFANDIWSYSIIALPFSYLFYTIANKLTFEYKILQKVGYICSIEFVGDVIKKIRKKSYKKECND